ncbi:unnamed protein product [Moneuplotes crassus]|uniref:Sulfite exporter TauE/SafE family protein n=1 Tax=Euplotes crassus TaxID=5936 RepID=A0AAD1UGL0_EUPCR|nr:unnamed protein product [Moneuplotes crassus]
MQIGVFEIVGGVLLFFVTVISKGIGLLGAGLVLPISKILFNLSHRESIEVASPAILFAVLIKFIALLIRKNEKYKNRRVVDFKFATVILPLVLIGAFWGEVFHAIIARAIESVIFCLIVAFLLVRTFMQSINKYKLHKRLQKKKKKRNLSVTCTRGGSIHGVNDSLRSSINSESINTEFSESLTINDDNEDSEEKQKMKKYLEKVESMRQQAFEGIDDIHNHPKFDQKYKPRYIKRAIPVLIVICMLVLQHLLRGSRNFDSTIQLEPCSTKYWLIMLGYTLILLAIFCVVFLITKYERTYHGDIGYEISYDWSLWTFIKVTVVSIFAGYTTTGIGVGLAFLCSPLLHSLNFPEDISEHTPLFLELIVRTVNVIHFMIIDIDQWTYMLWFAAWILPGAFIGAFIVLPFINNNHFRTSVILGLGTLLLAIACVATAVIDGINIARDVREGVPLLNFHGYCDESN